MRKMLLVFFFVTNAFGRFDELFLDKTMRVNYFHTGNRGQEVIALGSVVSDGRWAGSRTHLLDTLNLGNYFFEVVDRETNQTIYSRGFASVFGEWITTDEAKDRAGTSRSPSASLGRRNRCNWSSRDATRTTRFSRSFRH